MKFMVDTHILLWALNSPSKIHGDITQILQNDDATICYSQISLWEIAIKYALGKLDLKGHSPEEFYQAAEESFMLCETLDNKDLISSHRLPQKHKDPFDRMMVWQCIKEGHTLLSANSKLQDYQENGLQIVLNT